MLVVSYSISTSNHNFSPTSSVNAWLYLIPFLHQTTTGGASSVMDMGCILFHFYIKPQQDLDIMAGTKSCILFHFYIKPQLSDIF